MLAAQTPSRWILSALVIAMAQLPSFALGQLETEETKSGATKFESLFDGESLSGWEGDPRFWSVSEGVLTGSTHPDGINKNTFLVAKGLFEDFILRLQFKLTNHASGIQIRSKIPDPQKPFIVVGYQADIGGGDTGTFYEEQGRGTLAATNKDQVKKLLKPEDWNTYEIEAKGNEFIVRLIGEATSIYEETRQPCPKTGRIALQLQAGPAMKIEFRDLQIRNIEP